MKKFYFAMLAVATMAFVGCEPKPGPEIIDDGNDEELVLPNVAAPAAGMTTVVLYAPENTTKDGMYAVGKIDGTNDWKEKDIDTYRFTKVAGEERWYQFTFPYAADMEIKVCAIPSDPSLAGWSYQWAKNVDPNDPNCTETEDHVIIAQGTGELVYENGGQPKLKGLADGGVIFINIKAWAADPNIKDEPAATAAIKHPWNGGDWTYQEMTKENDTTFTYKSRFGNNGCNIALDVNGTQETWYPNDGTIIFEAEQDFAVGDSVEFKFISRKGTAGVVYVTMLEKGETPVVEPVMVTVKAKIPQLWADSVAKGGEVKAWVWPTGGDGSLATPTKEGDWYVYTTPEPVPGLNIIFKMGDSWSDAYQTVDITDIRENTCYELVSGDGKVQANVIDCQE